MNSGRFIGEGLGESRESLLNWLMMVNVMLKGAKMTRGDHTNLQNGEPQMRPSRNEKKGCGIMMVPNHPPMVDQLGADPKLPIDVKQKTVSADSIIPPAGLASPPMRDLCHEG